MKRVLRISSLLLVMILSLAVATTGCKKKTKTSSEDGSGKPDIVDTGNGNTGDSTPPAPTDDEATAKSRIRTVYFDFDRSDVRPDMRDEIKENADIFREWSNWMITVEGHCDERGTTEYNLALGERRAIAAKQALVAEGIAATRLTTVSFGEERAVDPGHTESSWSRNRRAEFRAK